MKEVKRRLEVLSLYDCTGIVRHLEKMALDGWALEGISNSIWRYRRIEPKELRYSVVYLPSSSEFDPGPTEASRDLQAFCAQAGWVQVASLAQMHIFRNEDPQAVPIETDPELQVATIHKAMKKNFIPSQTTMLGLGIMQLLLSWSRYGMDPLSFLASNSSLVGVLCWIMVIGLSVTDLCKYFSWHRKAVEAARDGEFLPTRGSEKLQKASLWLLAAVVLAWLLTLGSAQQGFYVAVSFGFTALVFVAVFGVKALLKKRGASTGTTRTAVWVTSIVMALVMCGGLMFVGFLQAENDWFEEEVIAVEVDGEIYHVTQDPLPLYISDLMDTDQSLYATYLNKTSSLLLTITSTSQSPVPDGGYVLGVNIYDIHCPLIREAVWKEVKDYGDNSELVWQDMGIEGAEIYRHYRNGEAWNTLLIRLENKFILLHPGWEMTQEQIQTAIDILTK